MKSEIDIVEQIKGADLRLKEGTCLLSHRDEIIDQYVTNELSEEAKNAFDEHCFNCDTCFRALKNREEFVRLIKSEGRTIFADIIEGRRPASRFQGILNKLTELGTIGPAKWAFAAVVTLVILAGGYWLLRDSQQTDLLASIRFDDRVPHAFTPQFGTSLRAPSQVRDDEIELEKFYGRFLAGMAEYRKLNYSGAIELLGALRATVDRLPVQAANDTVVTVARDYYFYFGVSHLALARSRRAQFDEATRKQHLETAIELLEQAELLGEQHDLRNGGRDHYFLGLAYGFAKNHDSAIAQLAQMESESEYYDDSQKLLRQWSR